MSLNRKQAPNYLSLLPYGAIKEIYEEIGQKVTYQQVIRVLKGTSADRHSIIDLAITKIKSHQKKIDRQNKALEALELNDSPLKTS